MADRQIMISIAADGTVALREMDKVGAGSKKMKKDLNDVGTSTDRLKSAFDTLNIKSHLQIEAETSKIRAAFAEIKNSAGSTATDINKARQAMDKNIAELDAPLIKTATAVFGLDKALKAMGVTAAVLTFVPMIADAGKAAAACTMLAGRVEMLNAVMPVIGNNAGYTAKQMDAYAEGVKKMGITTEESRRTVLRMASSHMDLSDSAGLARIAQDAGRIATINSSEALQRMTDGIVTNQVEILRNLGLTVDFEKAHRKLANSMGKDVEALTETERIQARTNAVMEKGKDIAGTYATTMGTTGGQVLSVTRLHKELMTSVGDVFLPATSVAVNAYSASLKWLFDKISENKPALKELAADLAGIAIAVSHPLDSITNVILDPWLRDEEEINRQRAIDIEYQQTVAGIKKRQEAVKIAAGDEARAKKEREDTDLATRDRRRSALDSELSVRLAAIKASTEKETQSYKTQEKDLDLLLAQRVISESDFYTQKTTLERAAIQTTITGLEKEKTAIQAEMSAKQGLYKKDEERIKEQASTKAKVAAIDAEIEKQRQESTRKGIDLKIKDVEQERQLALTSAKIAEADFQAQAQWLDKLDAYKQKTGAISDEAALTNRYNRERQTLELQQRTLGVQIDAEKSDIKRDELIAEYWRIQQQIEQSKQAELNDANALVTATQQLVSAHNEKMLAIAASADVAGLQFSGQNQAALDLQTANENAAIVARYNKQMLLADENQAAQLAATQAFEEQKYQIQTQYAQRQAELWWSSAQTYIGFGQQMTTMGIQMLMAEEGAKGQIGKRMLATSIRFLSQSLQQFMFNKAKENLLNAASEAGKISDAGTGTLARLSMLQTEAAAQAAFFYAMSLNPYGGQAYAAPAAAMSGVSLMVIPSAITAVGAEMATGMSASLGMAAAWAAGGMLVGALGEAAASSIEGGSSGSGTAAGYGSGTPSSPVVTSALPSDNYKAAPVINVHIYGSVVDHDKFAREMVPSIRKAVADGVR